MYRFLTPRQHPQNRPYRQTLLRRCFSDVESALESNPNKYTCHPDYYERVNAAAQPGSFPNNIQRTYWIHSGFENSVNANFQLYTAPNARPELHAILRLDNGTWVYIKYNPSDANNRTPYMRVVLSVTLEVLVMFLDQAVYNKYFEETEQIISFTGNQTVMLINGVVTPINSIASQVHTLN
jgi:hypothetical protein